MTNQKGFTVVEGVLILIIVAMLGFTGWFVWHSQQNTDKINSQAAKNSQPVTTDKNKPSYLTAMDNSTSQNYFTIKAWGVRAAYNGTDSFVYKIRTAQDSSNNNFRYVTVTSKNLISKYQCTDYGAGGIERLKPTDKFGEGDPSEGPTAEQAAKQDQFKDSFGHVGNYYFYYFHDQAACGGIGLLKGAEQNAGVNAQNAASNEVMALVHNFEQIK